MTKCGKCQLKIIFIRSNIKWHNDQTSLALTSTISTFCPQPALICFASFYQYISIISLYNTERLIFVKKTECVFCKVRTKFLNIIYINLRYQRCAVNFRARLQARLCHMGKGKYTSQKWGQERRWVHRSPNSCTLSDPCGLDFDPEDGNSYVPPNLSYSSTKLHDILSQNTAIFSSQECFEKREMERIFRHTRNAGRRKKIYERHGRKSHKWGAYSAIILSQNSRHYFTQTVSRDGWQPVPICRVTGSTDFSAAHWVSTHHI